MGTRRILRAVASLVLFSAAPAACVDPEDADAEFDAEDDGDDDGDVIFRPGILGCPYCTITTRTTLRAALGNGWESLTDTNVLVTLILTNASVVSYNLGNVDLTATTKTFSLAPAPAAAVASATITITFAGSPPIVITEPLRVIP